MHICFETRGTVETPGIPRQHAMSIFSAICLLAGLLLLFLTLPVVAQTAPASRLNARIFSGLRLRSIGPAENSGRVSAVAADPKDRSHFFVGAAAGGVWKTVNGGTTFTPVFDHEGSSSIGDIAIDPENPSIVWVGTGEGNGQRSVGYGDGIYKSEDGGDTWKNMGLKNSEHIGRILIDAHNSDVVYVAAQGPLWSAGGDRGLFKTTDGGKTWKNVLHIGEYTGVTDIVMDSANPNILYAASWQRARKVYAMIDGGPESAIYKSTDAGETWTKLTNGLPDGDVGRIALATAPSSPGTVYAAIETAGIHSAIYRSKDFGASWQRRSAFGFENLLVESYFGKLIVDPKNANRLYDLTGHMMVSDDGGKTFHVLDRRKYVDNHALWIDPNDTNYYLAGCDGGLFESFDRGATWRFFSNLPITEFYEVTTDNSKIFYNVYGGSQDTGGVGGPARTRDGLGIPNSDWFETADGDGQYTQIDPQDPNTIYTEYQNGTVWRLNLRTGQSLGIKPQPSVGSAPYRWNWTTPLLISPHSHTRLYIAANVVFRSDDRGNSWRTISGDLTRHIDPNTLPIMGKVWPADAVAKNMSTAFYGNITALSESPKQEGLMYAGTDDGLIQVTSDDGKSWTRHEHFPGVPDTTYVSRIAASQFDVNTVYAAFDNHKNGDFKSYLLKSTDRGHTWTSIASNLPERGSVHAFIEDPVNPNLMFVGTEFGLFFTIDGGGHWIPLRGNFPTVDVKDLAIQKRDSDLVVATFGRGIYILDDIAPLRTLKPGTLQREAALFPAQDALLYIPTRWKDAKGWSEYVAPNPPFGATFTYYLKNRYLSKQQKRHQAEATAARKGETVPYPSGGELRAEAHEQPPSVFLIVYDASGKSIRQIDAPNAPGMHRVSWDLRYPSMAAIARPGVGHSASPYGPIGPLVMPGHFSVKLFKQVDGVVTELSGPESFDVAIDPPSTISPADSAALFAFQRKVAKLYGNVSGATDTANDLQRRMKDAELALQRTPDVDPKLSVEANQIDHSLNEFLRNVDGDTVLLYRFQNVPESIGDRVRKIMANERFAMVRPTQTDIDSYNTAAKEFHQNAATLERIVKTDLPKLEHEMNAAGSPWTPGRLPSTQ